MGNPHFVEEVVATRWEWFAPTRSTWNDVNFLTGFPGLSLGDMGTFVPKHTSICCQPTNIFWRLVIFWLGNVLSCVSFQELCTAQCLYFCLHVCKKDFSPKLPINIPTTRDRPSPRLRKNHIPSLRRTASLNPWKWIVGRHVYIGMPSSLPSSPPRCTGKKHHQDLQWYEISGLRIPSNL